MSKQKQSGMLLLLASITFAALSCSVSSNKEPILRQDLFRRSETSFAT
jgi:hypothetical protein